LFALARGLAAQTLEVSPARVMADEPAAIRASGLEPNEHVVIRASLTDGAGARWAAQAEFVAGAGGAVDASQQAPVAGSYKEVSAMGLVWSMLPVSKSVQTYTARIPQAGAPMKRRMSLGFPWGGRPRPRLAPRPACRSREIDSSRRERVQGNPRRPGGLPHGFCQ
jgi:hypothetical protein